MTITDASDLQTIANSIIISFRDDKIDNFGDWLKHYHSTIEEIEEIVNTYCRKVSENKLSEIEHWESVVMIDALALYMIELEITHVPTGEMMNRILKIYVETIRMYGLKKKGYLKLVGNVFISDITKYRFVKVNEPS